jgi:DNA polymerase III delta subunit
VYVISGEERFFVRRALGVLRERVLTSPDLRDLVYHVFYAAESRGDELVELATTMPFFDRTQLIVVYEADKLAASWTQRLEEYIEDPAPFTALVLVAGDKVAKGAKGTKSPKAPKNSLFEQVAEKWPEACFSFGRLNKRQRLEWLRELAREKGLVSHVSSGMLEQLVEDLQVPLEILEARLEVLALYGAEGKSSELEDALGHLVPDIPDHQGYLLTDAVLKGDEAGALETLHRFLEQGTPPLLLLSRFVWLVRLLWRVKEALELREPLDTVLSRARVRFKQDQYTSAARRVPWKALKGMVLALEDKERRLKSSRLEAGWHLEELCGELVRGLASGAGRS